MLASTCASVNVCARAGVAQSIAHSRPIELNRAAPLSRDWTGPVRAHAGRMLGPAVVAIFNSSPDAIALLSAPLREAGFTVVGAPIHELRERRVDLDHFLRTHRPHVVVFDVAPPYGLNWRLLDRLREMPSAKDVRFIVTSVNPQRAEE